MGPAYLHAWSPDGRQIAYLGHDCSYGDYTQPGLWVVGVAEDGGPAGWPRRVATRVNRPVGDLSIGDTTGYLEPDSPPA